MMDTGLERDFESPTEMQPASEYNAPALRYRAIARRRRKVSSASGTSASFGNG
jgi:hypothetical protein